MVLNYLSTEESIKNAKLYLISKSWDMRWLSSDHIKEYFHKKAAKMKQRWEDIRKFAYYKQDFTSLEETFFSEKDLKDIGRMAKTFLQMSED